jgi:acyl dehydratase
MASDTAEKETAREGLIQGQITPESVALMRRRIGFPNPTIRSGYLQDPWNKICTEDAIRRWALSIGDDNPLYVDPAYAKKTRWGRVVAPPGFEKSMGFDRNPIMDPAELKETSKALRGVQLFYSGGDQYYWAPVTEGMELYRSRVVGKVDEKTSEFAGKSVIVTNDLCYWDQNENVIQTGVEWYVHTERRKTSKEGKYAKEKPAWYSDEQLAEIEDCYEKEYQRRGDTLFLEDCKVGQKLPKMVKGPLTITDLMNFHMGIGWITYGNPPYRLGHLNRKNFLRGFYTKNEFNAWDTVQRVHWDKGLANEVGVNSTYDIGTMRQMYTCHYLTNYAGDDGWVQRVKWEVRRFNYMGDTTWIEGEITHVRIDPQLGPLIEIAITGKNQRGDENLKAGGTILVASREHGPVKLPKAPPITPHRRKA